MTSKSGKHQSDRNQDCHCSPACICRIQTYATMWNIIFNQIFRNLWLTFFFDTLRLICCCFIIFCFEIAVVKYTQSMKLEPYEQCNFYEKKNKPNTCPKKTTKMNTNTWLCICKISHLWREPMTSRCKFSSWYEVNVLTVMRVIVWSIQKRI